MKNIWKGIAITGIWIGVGIISLNATGDNIGVSAIMAMIATFFVSIV